MSDVNNPFDPVPLAPPNFQPRCPCLLLLDTSSSMKGKPVDELNAGVTQLYDSLLGDVVASDRVELAIVTFGKGDVEVLQTFQNPKPGQCPTLTVDGYTPMAAAIQRGLDLLDARLNALKVEGLKLYKPWVVLITDGAPTDGSAAVNAAIARVHDAQAKNRLVFWAFGVQGADMTVLSQLGGTHAMMLDSANFRALFDWISASLSAVSHSAPGGSVQLGPPPNTFTITV